MNTYDIAVIGAGLAGSIAALAIAQRGYSVVVVAPSPATTDGRTTALMDPSIRVLENLNLWSDIAAKTAPLATMQIIDGTNRLMRSPTVNFRASELGLEAFGYNIPNAPFIDHLRKFLQKSANVAQVESSMSALTLHDDGCEITTADGQTLFVQMIVGADGRQSAVRQAASISTKTWSYPQTALVLTFAHSLPHYNISTEFHTESGPFTQVPLPGNRSSLVWVCTPADAERRLREALDVLSREIETRMQSMLGAVTVDSAVQAYPLSGMTARKCGKGRVALIGEAAHAFPPIGAQGLNLSLRDIETLTNLLGPKSGEPLDPMIGTRFDARRRPDIATRTVGVDLLNRSLLSDFLPVQFLRAAGLQALSSAGPLRTFLMREGLAPGSSLSDVARYLREKIGRKRA